MEKGSFSHRDSVYTVELHNGMEVGYLFGSLFAWESIRRLLLRWIANRGVGNAVILKLNGYSVGYAIFSKTNVRRFAFTDSGDWILGPYFI